MGQKTVLITGTSTGIGAACVARQAKAGWKIYAAVRKHEDGERLAADVGGDVVPVILDVTDRAAIAAVLARIEDEVGSLDGLVNNAGIAVGGPIEVLTDDEWQHQFDVNFFSLVAMTREALPLVDKANGRFVHIGSIAGRISGPGLAPYSATKHAIEAFNWSLRAELERNTKMTSSVVEPGEIKTAIWDKGHASLREIEQRLAGSGLAERYGFLLDGTRGFLEEGKTKGIDADRVAKAVEHALTASRPRARYLVGPDAQGVGVISRLPDRLREKLLALNQAKVEKAGRTLR